MSFVDFPSRRFFLAFVMLALSWQTARAQEAINTKAATQPATGVLAFREQFRYTRYDRDPTGLGREADQFTARTMLQYGLCGNLAVDVSLPFSYYDIDNQRPGTADRDFALGDAMVLLKWRPWQNDYGPTDTARVGVVAGGAVPVGSAPYTKAAWNPVLGAVYTHVHGRAGWNVALTYLLTTDGDPRPLEPGNGRADALFHDVALLYRLAPAEYTAESTGAWYGVLEFNGVYETNGDEELRVAPGVMYEGADLALELSVQLPLARRLRHRPERAFSTVVGFRLLF